MAAGDDHSTLLCVLCSAGAGLGAGFFGCVLSWANHVKLRNDGKHTTCSRYVAIFGVIGSTVFGLGSLAGLYFGPVTLVVVIRAGTLLPANAFFSQLFGFRPLTRDDLLGTLVTVSGVVCFSLFGGAPPQSPTESEYMEMLGSTGAKICNFILLGILVISGFIVFANKGGKGRMKGAHTMFVIAVANVSGCSSAFMDVAAKGWSAALDTGGIDHAWNSLTFWVCFIANCIFLLSMRISMIYGCKRCDVLLFVPVSTVSNILYSVLAGMVVMKEYRQVVSWPGLLSASFVVLGGVVMLVSGPARSDDHEGESPPSHHWYTESEEEEEAVHQEELASAARPLRRVSTGAATEEFASLDADMDVSGDSEDEEEPSQDDLLSTDSQDSGEFWNRAGLFGHAFRAKGQELVSMNQQHREAARIRQRWCLVKQNLHRLVGEAAGSLVHHRSTRSRTGRVRTQNSGGSLGGQGVAAAPSSGGDVEDPPG